MSGHHKEQTQWRLKSGLAQSATAAYFDVKKVIEIVEDASPVGLAELFVQEKRVIVCASRALSDVKTRYVQSVRNKTTIHVAISQTTMFRNKHRFLWAVNHRSVSARHSRRILTIPNPRGSEEYFRGDSDPVVDKVFSLFTFPEVDRRTDDGPLFYGHMCKSFLAKCRVHH